VAEITPTSLSVACITTKMLDSVHVQVPRTVHIEANNRGTLKQARSVPRYFCDGILVTSVNSKTRHENMLYWHALCNRKDRHHIRAQRCLFIMFTPSFS